MRSCSFALRDNDEDLWKVRRTIETLAGETRVNYEDLAETVSVSQGIDARKWPRDIANAEARGERYTEIVSQKVKDGTVFASDVKDFYQLMGLLKHIDTRKADGSLDQFSIDKGFVSSRRVLVRALVSVAVGEGSRMANRVDYGIRWK